MLPSSKVKKVLKSDFIEARLHADGEANLERIEAVQAELAKTISLPTYVIQDPQTKRILGAPLSGVTTKNTFLEYLESALEAKEQVGRLPGR